MHGDHEDDDAEVCDEHAPVTGESGRDESDECEEAEPFDDGLCFDREAFSFRTNEESHGEGEADDEEDFEEHLCRVQRHGVQQFSSGRVQRSPERNADGEHEDIDEVADGGHRNRQRNVAARTVREHLRNVAGWAASDKNHAERH